jgi:hypothetical protein
MNIEKTLTVREMLNKIYDHGVYVESENLHVQRWSGFDQYSITDLSNALLTGKTCRKYSITSNGAHGNLDVTNWFLQDFDGDLRKAFDFCESLRFEKDQWGYDKSYWIGGVNISRRDEKSNRTFSPFALDRVKPLKAIPEKWTMRHVYAAIINKQCSNLKCDGVYSDDYAYDSAVNYHKGEINHPLAFVRRIIESPSGWHCFLSDGWVNVDCHSFDSNSFMPTI